MKLILKMPEQAEKIFKSAVNFQRVFPAYHLPMEKLAELPESPFRCDFLSSFWSLLLKFSDIIINDP